MFIPTLRTHWRKYQFDSKEWGYNTHRRRFLSGDHFHSKRRLTVLNPLMHVYITEKEIFFEIIWPVCQWKANKISYKLVRKPVIERSPVSFQEFMTSLCEKRTKQNINWDMACFGFSAVWNMKVCKHYTKFLPLISFILWIVKLSWSPVN